jgi:hypothetical protein
MVGARKGLIGIVYEKAIELKIYQKKFNKIFTALSTNQIHVQNRLN